MQLPPGISNHCTALQMNAIIVNCIWIETDWIGRTMNIRDHFKLVHRACMQAKNHSRSWAHFFLKHHCVCVDSLSISAWLDFFALPSIHLISATPPNIKCLLLFLCLSSSLLPFLFALLQSQSQSFLKSSIYNSVLARREVNWGQPAIERWQSPVLLIQFWICHLASDNYLLFFLQLAARRSAFPFLLLRPVSTWVSVLPVGQ